MTKLQVVIGSKRSSHSNAYFYGFGKNKRIVLFDTLLLPELRPVVEDAKGDNDDDEAKIDENSADGSGASEETSETTSETTGKETVGCTVEEVVAVLSHELGHWCVDTCTVYRAYDAFAGLSCPGTCCSSWRCVLVQALASVVASVWLHVWCSVGVRVSAH